MLMHNLTTFTHTRESRNSKKLVWTLYPCTVITPPNLESMSTASYLFCVNYLTTSFHQPHRYPLKIYIPTELSAENPAQYVCMVITQTLASTVEFYWNLHSYAAGQRRTYVGSIKQFCMAFHYIVHSLLTVHKCLKT